MRAIVLPMLSALAACAPDANSPAPAPSPSGPGVAPIVQPADAEPPATARPAPDRSAPGRQHQYTSLENCKLVREEREEMAFTERECGGLGFFTLRISDSDARQRMTLVPPTSELYRVPVDRIGGGGFSSFGKTAEWRGPAGDPFKPDALIVRYRVAEKPSPAPETSYLLVIRLGDDACLVAVIPPGATQNDTAREAADGAKACLPG